MQEIKELRVQSRVNWEDLLEKKWQPTLGFLSGKSHGQRTLESYSPWSCKELDTTYRLKIKVIFFYQVMFTDTMQYYVRLN